MLLNVALYGLGVLGVFLAVRALRYIWNHRRYHRLYPIPELLLASVFVCCGLISMYGTWNWLYATVAIGFVGVGILSRLVRYLLDLIDSTISDWRHKRDLRQSRMQALEEPRGKQRVEAAIHFMSKGQQDVNYLVDLLLDYLPDASEENHTSDAIVRSLENRLRRGVHDIDTESLKELSTLKAYKPRFYKSMDEYGECVNKVASEIDCSTIRSIARKALLSR